MIIIGLCGNSGSGKGTVSKSFLRYGVPSIDADAVYRNLTLPNSKLNYLLAEHFGPDVLNADNSLNRAELSKIVFSDKSGKFLNELNKMTHFHILAEAEKQIADYDKDGVKAVIFDAPLLFESGFDKKCNVIITVAASLTDKLNRIIKRDGIDFNKANARIHSQLSEEFLKEHSDFVIENNGSLENIDTQVDKIIKNIFNEV